MSTHLPRDPEQEARALLGALPRPSPGASVRVRRALDRSLDALPPFEVAPPRRWPWVLGGLGTFAAAAAAVAWFVAQPPPLAPAAPLAVALESPADWHSEALSPDVSLNFQGTGAVAGDTRAPRIQWERGALTVEVTPQRGIDLVVATREAEVRVVGTGFTVSRDALGTHVAVLHGRVEVRCGAGEPRFLGGGETESCLPTSAAGLLGRARALQAAGAGPAAVLAAVEDGLDRTTSEGALRDELRVMRIALLGSLGRHGEALADAQGYLDRPSAPRSIEVFRMAAQLALADGGCAAAAPWLAALRAHPAAEPADAALGAECAGPG